MCSLIKCCTVGGSSGSEGLGVLIAHGGQPVGGGCPQVPPCAWVGWWLLH